MLEEAWSLPMMGGKCVIKRDELRACLDGLHTYYPTELAKAKSLLDERERILQKAKADAEKMVKDAEKKARAILNEQDILVEATNEAQKLTKEAKEDAAKMRRAAVEYVDNILGRVETLYDSNLASIKQARRIVQGEKE